MRTVYLGTSAFAATILERLAGSPHRPALVVTRPDRPAGRGRRLTPPPVAGTARELGLDLDQPESVNAEEARERIAAAAPEAVVVCAFGALIREPLLSDHLVLNVHPSLLPRWRGAAPIERAIMAGDGRTGVAIMRLTEGLDEGPVCAVAEEPIRSDDDFGTLSARLERAGGDLLVQALDDLPPFAEQGEDGVSYAEKIGPADRTLDGTERTAAELERTVRALHPHIGARVALSDGSWLGVHRADAAALPSPEAGDVGVVDGRLLLGTRDGALELVEVQPAGGRAMPAGAFVRGHKLA